MLTPLFAILISLLITVNIYTIKRIRTIKHNLLTTYTEILHQDNDHSTINTIIQIITPKLIYKTNEIIISTFITPILITIFIFIKTPLIPIITTLLLINTYKHTKYINSIQKTHQTIFNI